jgi:uncharacterized protein (TIGR02757 family)
MRLDRIKPALDRLYARYNQPEFVRPDPVEFLHRYESPADREVAGLVASSLAHGRAAQISRSISTVLAKMGPSPRRFLEETSEASMRQALMDFRHRLVGGDRLASLLLAARRVIRRYGSLRACFVAGFDPDCDTILLALSAFVDKLTAGGDGWHRGLLPSPDGGSACKRLNLFLRWMVRRDAIDPGGWDDVPASKLVIPLDTHMHRVGRALGLTKRKQADLRTAQEITAAFRTISPDDPVKYDFALTRLGIRSDADLGAFLSECGGPSQWP